MLERRRVDTPASSRWPDGPDHSAVAPGCRSRRGADHAVGLAHGFLAPARRTGSLVGPIGLAVHVDVVGRR